MLLLTNGHWREVEHVARDAACDVGNAQVGRVSNSTIVVNVVQSAPTAGGPRRVGAKSRTWLHQSERQKDTLIGQIHPVTSGQGRI